VSDPEGMANVPEGEEVAKASRDLASLLAQHLTFLAKYSASGTKYVWDILMDWINYVMMDMDAELPEGIGQARTQMISEVLARTVVEHITMLYQLDVEEIAEKDLYQSVLQYLTLHSRGASAILPSNPVVLPDILPNIMQEEELRRHIQTEAQSPEGQKRPPDRLLTLKEAADLYPNEMKYDDIRRWHSSGLLEEKGRRWLTRPGGRSIPLVSQAEVAYLKDNRPPRGPIASFKQKMRKDVDSLAHRLYTPAETQTPSELARQAPLTGETQQLPLNHSNLEAHVRQLAHEAEILPEPKLITLQEAVETYGIPYETLRSRIRSGHLQVKGREIFHTHGGGKILVDEQDIFRSLSEPPARGRPPAKLKQGDRVLSVNS
jgi:hypothetical protein